tara:strand:+ start:415 stop:1161 length:747 start_codon:yes stop_codon:yes gene_type:complete
MSDSNKKFPENSDFYHKKRHWYYKDWYWYLPEWLKYLIVGISIVTTPLFVFVIVSGFDAGGYLYSISLIGLWLWLGVSGTDDAWWMPERVTDHFKYNSRFLGDGVNSDSANVFSDGIAKCIFIIVASPVNAMQWISLIFYFTGPFLIGAIIGVKLMIDPIFFTLLLCGLSYPYMLGWDHINKTNEALKISIVNGINPNQLPIKNIKEDDDSLNIQYDIIQLCKKQVTLETWIYCLSIVSIELLIIYFL